MSLKKGCSASRASMSFSTLGLPNGAHLFGNVDAHWTPCDATAAADAARRIELIDPGGQLVRHPLTVSRSSRWPYRAAVDVRMIGGEAGIPSAPPFGVFACEVRYLFDRATEASGTHHRTVRA